MLHLSSEAPSRSTCRWNPFGFFIAGEVMMMIGGYFLNSFYFNGDHSAYTMTAFVDNG